MPFSMSRRWADMFDEGGWGDGKDFPPLVQNFDVNPWDATVNSLLSSWLGPAPESPPLPTPQPKLDWEILSLGGCGGQQPPGEELLRGGCMTDWLTVVETFSGFSTFFFHTALSTGGAGCTEGSGCGVGWYVTRCCAQATPLRSLTRQKS